MKMMLGRRATILTRLFEPSSKSEQMGCSRRLYIYSPYFYISNASHACRAKTAQCRPGRKRLHASPHAIRAELHNDSGFLIQCFGYITFKGRRRAVQMLRGDAFCNHAEFSFGVVPLSQRYDRLSVTFRFEPQSRKEPRKGLSERISETCGQSKLASA